MKHFRLIPQFLIGLGAGILLVCHPLPAFARAPSAPVPLSSWVYPVLDNLAAKGLIESALQGSRPYSRREVARQLAEALGELRRADADPVSAELLQRLRLEFADDLKEVENNATPSSYFKPVRSLELAYVYQEGQPSRIADQRYGVGNSRVDASQFSLNTNNAGLDYRENSNLQLTFETEARFGSLLVNWRPVLLVREERGGGNTADLKTLQGLVALDLGPFEFSAGRQSLWWGQGRHGSLVLTNNAAPLDMVRIHTPSPLLLPWIFRFLGPFRFDLFWSRLEAERVVPEPYFAGLRLNFKPLPWFEIGASRTVLFGGDGQPDIKAGDFITILAGKNLSGSEDTSNQLAAIDFRLRLPFLWGAELYHEWGGEDEAQGFFANMCRLYGLYLPRIEPTGRLSLRAEFADLAHIDDNSPAWYRHGIYRSGYTYNEKLLGHHAGGASRDFYTELRILLPRQVTAHLGFDLEQRGFDQPLREVHRQGELGFDWQLSRNLSLQARYALDRVKNFGYTAGPDRTFQFGEVGVKTTW